MKDTTSNRIAGILGIALSIGLLVAVIFGAIFLFAKIRVYTQSQRGLAALKEAEYTRQIAVLDAQAEVERARGVAEANKIIGESLQGNEAYLKYLWVQGLQDGSSEVIYIPTEANLPLLEARDSR